MEITPGISEYLTINEEDLTSFALSLFKINFAEVYGLHLVMYSGAGNRKKVKLDLHAVVSGSMFSKIQGFAVESIDFDSKTIHLTIHSGLEKYIVNYPELKIKLNEMMM